MPKFISILPASSREATPGTTSPSFRIAHAGLICVFITAFNAAAFLFFAAVIYQVMGKRALFSLGVATLLAVVLISLLRACITIMRCR